MTLSSDDLRARLVAIVPYRVPLLYDISYACPTSDWLFNKFAPWFWKRHPEYTRKNDCDNFARRFCVDAQQLHAESGNSAEALAVGEFCYFGTTHIKGPHALNIAFVDDGQIVFIEPQRAQRIALLPIEIQTCFHVAF